MHSSKEFAQLVQQERVKRADASLSAFTTLAAAATLLLLLPEFIPHLTTNGIILLWTIIPIAAANCSRFYWNRRTYFILGAVATLPLYAYYISDSEFRRRLIHNPDLVQQINIWWNCIAFFTGALTRSICYIAEQFVEVIEDPPHLRRNIH